MDEFNEKNLNYESEENTAEGCSSEDTTNDNVSEPIFTAQPIEPKPDKYAEAFALTSMIVGICSIVLCVGFIPAIVAIVFGALAKNRGSKSPMATAGIVTGVVALCLGIAYCITVCSIAFSGAILR